MFNEDRWEGTSQTSLPIWDFDMQAVTFSSDSASNVSTTSSKALRLNVKPYRIRLSHVLLRIICSFSCITGISLSKHRLEACPCNVRQHGAVCDRQTRRYGSLQAQSGVDLSWSVLHQLDRCTGLHRTLGFNTSTSANFPYERTLLTVSDNRDSSPCEYCPSVSLCNT